MFYNSFKIHHNNDGEITRDMWTYVEKIPPLQIARAHLRAYDAAATHTDIS